MGTVKLKPCPFCGGDAKNLSMNRVGCKACGIRTVSKGSRWASVKDWNTRLGDSFEAVISPSKFDRSDTLYCGKCNIILNAHTADGSECYNCGSVVKVPGNFNAGGERV
jgi:hypothetical protein